ncbi:protein of unknown function [Oryzisolibacter propanilivorax]|uniref:Calcium-binding protein n=1 Tax=Oryzisolibacter propanilivorax TaxID=1527607 RepID=A0A1G9P1X9_9BURK|nr:DUF937 domain-containing protein [Oryzisolibacter propanilivorax]SDL92563.1 protein of unknown function [Oryzisolibacter propanilivorax]
MQTESSPHDTAPLTQELLQQLQGAPMARIAGELGVDQQQAQHAAAMAVPLLLGALGRNAQQPQGAQALLQALQRDHMPAQPAAGLDLGGLLGAVLGGGAGRASDGGGILDHILGGARGQAQAGLGQASGLGDGAGHLLRLLAPIVMSFLAQRVRSGGLGTGGLGDLLGHEHAQLQRGGAPAGGLLAQVLDQDGNGRVDLGDLLKAGAGLLGGRR